METKSVAAGEFKSKCLSLLDEVKRTGQTLVITKRGRPVAQVVPFEQPKPIEGSVIHCDDIVSPAIPEDDWQMSDGEW